MGAESLPREAEQYLQGLSLELAELSNEQRSAALDDVRAHLTEALASGRSVDKTLTGLGPATSIAAQYREELGAPEMADGSPSGAERARAQRARAQRATVVLNAAAACLAVLTAALLWYWDAGSQQLDLDERWLGLGSVLLAALPLILPRQLRLPVGLANAVLVSVVVVLGLGLMLAPVALAMWVAVIVPWRIGDGLDLKIALIWRVLGAVLIALPVGLVAAGLITGALAVEPMAVAVAALLLVCAVGYALGLRVTVWILAVLGVVLLASTFVSLGMLGLGVWWVGGFYVSFGLASLMAWGTAPLGKENRVL